MRLGLRLMPSPGTAILQNSQRRKCHVGEP
jgi:hypothetical protein